MNNEKTVNKNEQNFYPDLAYNRANRKKFFTLMILLIACMGLVVGLMVSMKQYVFAMVFGVILIMTFFLIPSALKTHPVKANEPAISISNREVTVQGKTYRAQDIDKVYVTVLLNPVSKIDSENKEYAQKMAQTYPEEIMLGNVDMRLKPGIAKKGESIYTTVSDCLGACTALVSAGVKHYSIVFNLKKINEPAQFNITKVEVKKQTLSELSEKDRLKQLM